MQSLNFALKSFIYIQDLQSNTMNFSIHQRFGNLAILVRINFFNHEKTIALKLTQIEKADLATFFSLIYSDATVSSLVHSLVDLF